MTAREVTIAPALVTMWLAVGMGLHRVCRRTRRTQVWHAFAIAGSGPRKVGCGPERCSPANAKAGSQAPGWEQGSKTLGAIPIFLRGVCSITRNCDRGRRNRRGHGVTVVLGARAADLAHNAHRPEGRERIAPSGGFRRPERLHCRLQPGRQRRQLLESLSVLNRNGFKSGPTLFTVGRNVFGGGNCRWQTRSSR